MTLTEASILTRKTIKISALLIVGVIALKILFGFSQKVITVINPPPPPKADFRFGDLEALKLPAFNANLKITPDASFSYKLQTVYTAKDGLPTLQDTVRIYFKPVPTKASFNAEEQLISQATALGFTGNPKRPTTANETKFIWQDPQIPLKTLEIDILTRNFFMQYDFLRDPAFLAQKTQPPGRDDAIKIAAKYLKDTNLYQEDFEKGQFEASYWRTSAGNLVSTTTIADADITRVDVFRANLPNIQSNYPKYKEKKELQIFPPDPNYGLIYFFLSGDNNPKKRVLRLSYTYWNIDKSNFGIYPLIPVQQAFEDLKKGKGYIASFNPKKPTKEVTIIDVFLAYYESEEQKNFIYPIYVFKGDDDFYGYVPAAVYKKPPPPEKKK